LAYPNHQNPPLSYLALAQSNNLPSPSSFVNETLRLYYNIYSIPFTTSGPEAMPILTLSGFQALILTDTLMDPDVQFKRLNYILSNNHDRIIDPETGRPFPSNQIPRTALPVGPDWDRIARQKDLSVRFNEELSGYMRELCRMGNWKHDVTMAGMSDGVWVYGPGRFG
jgi:hypothetical protein